MYFAASATAADDQQKHCIGAATASTVEGPYAAQTDALICDLSEGGAIDPAGFQDYNGDRYIVYKVDGNSIGHVRLFTHRFAQSATTLSLPCYVEFEWRSLIYRLFQLFPPSAFTMYMHDSFIHGLDTTNVIPSRVEHAATLWPQ